MRHRLPCRLPSRRAWLQALGVLALSPLGLGAAPAPPPAPNSLDAPNVVAITPQLISAGQPSAAALAGLAAQGFGAVISLAPLSSPDAVPDEAGIVQRQGLQFTNIPIPFNQPTAQDFQAFNAAMAAAGQRKVLVHCQINMRGSSMVFLHRVIVRHEDPDTAYADLTRVWTPNGVWHDFIATTLRQHGVDFPLY